MKEQEIGFISKYFGKINVGAIDLTAGELNTSPLASNSQTILPVRESSAYTLPLVTVR